MRCEYAHDDGAYVLGALSPAERATYERHLGTCPACREAVAEIAVLPGLLGRLDPATALHVLAGDQQAEAAESGAAPAGPARRNSDDVRMASLLDSVAVVRRRDQRRQRVRYAAAALAAACVVLIVMVGVGLFGGDSLLDEVGGDVPLAAMSPVNGQVPVSAEVGLADQTWGTEVTMRCVYDETDGSPKAWRLHLVAYGPDNETEQIGSWVASPGTPVIARGVTRFSGDELVRLALTRADGTQLLAYDVP